MTPQFTYDKKGNVIGVFLPIDEWNELIKHYPAASSYDEISQSNFAVPQWQIELGKKEIQNVISNATELMKWEQVKKQFKP